MIIKLKIQDFNNRNNMVIALSHAGYKVWVERTRETTLPSYLDNSTCYVCFEYPEPEIKSNSTATFKLLEGTDTHTVDSITGTIT